MNWSAETPWRSPQQGAERGTGHRGEGVAAGAAGVMRERETVCEADTWGESHREGQQTSTECLLYTSHNVKHWESNREPPRPYPPTTRPSNWPSQALGKHR